MTETNFKIMFALNAYINQLGISNDIQNFLLNNKILAEKLVKNFENRFNPQNPTVPEVLDVSTSKIGAIFDNLISKAIVRTNYFLNKSYISFKVNLSLFDSKLAELPKPITFREIFVFAEEFSGIHIRLGKIARGGIRWSDRKDDFRTEVLGLVKTQNTKNSIIVPVGSKGGFALKNTENLSGLSLIEAGKKYYTQFISGCLDITDNVINGKVISPKDVLILDEEDPYFVVAADKGTANFSDIANEISKQYNFWLGDAFASGGSNGYNHKAMGITAKGGWESVKRHFRELNKNIQTENFTVVAIGDMSGDVFGNGLLRSQATQLICAFNHMHIFVDPNPDAKTSFKERERLFNLQTSTWENYNMSLASKGAKLFKRSDAMCELTTEIKARFNIAEDTLSPVNLIKAILKSKFDLLWNGGIGTYVKASFETNEAAGDKANDSLRINGNELGAKVVGEGGNLGLTQKGRIEYALSGGKINTDAIDNSAGVDCSDHEVNIKILLNALAHSGKISEKTKDETIRKMENEVETLVLADNISQTLLLSLEQMRGAEAKEIYKNFVNHLEKNSSFSRINEKFPTDEEIETRYASGKTLTRPELSILIAYAKMENYAILLESDILKDSYNEKFLINYFPKEIKEGFLEDLKKHKLAHEIAATVIANRIVNFAGITFAFEAQKKSGKSLIKVISAYLVAEKILDIEKIFLEVESLKNEAKTQVQYQTLFVIRSQILMPVVLKILNETKEIASIETTASEFQEKIKSMKLESEDLTLIDLK
jgi:glutamate dehydrogenase